jgi:hypothetical protein
MGFFRFCFEAALGASTEACRAGRAGSIALQDRQAMSLATTWVVVGRATPATFWTGQAQPYLRLMLPTRLAGCSLPPLLEVEVPLRELGPTIMARLLGGGE